MSSGAAARDAHLRFGNLDGDIGTGDGYGRGARFRRLFLSCSMHFCGYGSLPDSLGLSLIFVDMPAQRSGSVQTWANPTWGKEVYFTRGLASRLVLVSNIAS